MHRLPSLRTVSVATFVLWFGLARPAAAAEGFFAEKNEHGVTVEYNGKPFAEYVFDGPNKPYIWPIIGPTGKRMTRAYPMETIEGEQHDHPHHRSLWFGQADLNGSDTWEERLTAEAEKNPKRAAEHLAKLGATRHTGYRTVEADAHHALIVTTDNYISKDGEIMVQDERRYTFTATPDARIIDVDIKFEALDKPVTFGDAKDAGFSVRVPTSMAVDSKKGGEIITSEGKTNAAAWGTRGAWCDYYGPVDGETLGIAMLNHPSSFRYPTPWHVRTYGLLTANPFGLHSLDKNSPDGTYVLEPHKTLLLRHRVIFHKGDTTTAKIAEAFAEYAKEK